MFLPFISLILMLLGHALAWGLWRRFTVAEVARNAADITANGSADDLRKGYHQRRTWARFWPCLGLVIVGSLSASFASLTSYLLSCAALGVGLATYFARWFTPMLNVAMKLDYKPEFYASPDSASWPDAAIWRKLRAGNAIQSSPTQSDAIATQSNANAALRQLLTRTWRVGLTCYALLLASAGALLFLK